MALPVNGSTSDSSLQIIYRPRKDERLSWPSWLTCSGRLTTLVVTHQLQVERRTWSVRRPETDVLPLCHVRTQVKSRVSIQTRELRLLTQECDFQGINIPNVYILFSINLICHWFRVDWVGFGQ